MRQLYLLLLFLIFAGNTIAQNGIIRGKVIDAKTGEELIGANLVLPSTDPLKGTITDFDGSFNIEGIIPGTYKMICSFISYEKKIIENVVVKAGDVTIINIKLGQSELDIEEVVVTAKTIKRTEAAMITLQRKSATVLDGISAQQMSRLSDGDAARALKRVTGVSVQGGKYIYVRGLSDRYSKTLLNNAEIPGLDPNKNTVQMDLFPSNIIENMVVHKTYSPNLPGSFTGGLVNVETKDFPEKYTFQFSTSLGYNSNANLNDHFLSYDGGKTDWLAFDDGTRKMPEIAKGKLPNRFSDDNSLAEVTRAFDNRMSPVEEKSFLNQSHSVSVGNQVDFLGKKLGFIAGLTYQRGYKYSDDGFAGRYKLNDRNATKLGTELYFDTDKQGEIEVLWGTMANASLKLNNNNKIGLTVLRNQSGVSEARYLDGMRVSDDPEMHFETRTLQYLQRSFTTGQINGEHLISSLNNLKIDWLTSLTQSKQDEPDLRFFSNSYKYDSNNQPYYYISSSKYSVPTRYYRDMKEINLDNKIDFELPFIFIGHSSKFKFGSAFVYKDRDFNEQKISFNENQDSYENNIENYFREENLWFYNGVQDGIYISSSKTSNKTNSYTASQSVLGSYLMADIPMEKLRVMIGVRFENAIIEAGSLNEKLEKGKLNNIDILPALNMTYNISENMNARFAVSRTLARPSFRELAPFASFDFVGDYIFVGNPNLKRTSIDNFDVRWEMYMKPGEIISLSGFYKNFHDPIERTFNTEAANPELTLRNVNKANILGFEIEFRKRLDFIEALKDFKIGGNFTFVKSEVSIDQKELDIKHIQDPSFPDTRVMYGLSPYIVNTYLNYTNDSLGLSANLGFNITGKQLYLINATGVPDVYQQPKPNLDFTMNKAFGERITLKLSVKNILDAETKQTYEFKNEEYIYSKYTMGRNFSFGFTYLIK